MRNKWLRFVAWLLTLPLLLVLVVGAFLYLALEESDYRGLVEAALADALGYRLEIRGGLAVAFSVPPTLIARDVMLVDVGRQPPQTLASASRVSFTCELLPLLFKQANFSVRVEQPRVRYEVDADGRSDWRLPKLGVRDGPWQFRLDGIELRQGRLLFRERTLDVALEADLNRVLLQRDGGRLQGTQDIGGVYNGVQFALLGELALGPAPDELELDLTARVSDPRSMAPRGTPAEAELQVTGRVRSLAAVPVLDLEVRSLVPDAAWLLRLLELDRFAERLRPGTGPVAFTTRFRGSHGQLRLDPLDLRLQQPGAALEAHGSATFSLGRHEMVLKLQGRLEDLAKSPLPLAGLPAEARGLGPVEGKARLLLNGDDLSLQDIELALDRPELRLAATGNASDLLREPRTSLDLTSAGASVAQLRQLPGLSFLGRFHPATVKGRLRLLYSGKDLRTERMQLTLERPGLQLAATGKVLGLRGDPEPDLEVTSDANRVADLAEPLGLPVPADLRDGSIRVRGRLVGAKGVYRLESSRAELAQDGLALSLEGRVTGLPRQPAVEGRARFRSDRLNRLDRLLGLELAPVLPMHLEGDLKLAAGHYEIGKLQAAVGDSQVSGDVVIDLGGVRPKIYARLASPHLDLDQLFGSGTGREAAVGTIRDLVAERRLFSRDPLPLDWLRAHDFDLELDARGVIWDHRKVEQAKGRVEAAGGRLRSHSLKMVLGDGEVDVALEIEAHRPGSPGFAFRWEAHQAEAERLLALPKGIVLGGAIDGYIDVQARGSSPQELAAGLNGSLLLRMGPSQLVEAGLKGLSSGVLGQILRGFLVKGPKDTAQGYTRYHCGVLGMHIADGVAVIDDTLVLEADRFTIYGYGQIDLAREIVELEVRPLATAGLGPSVSDIVGGFRVVGPLVDPSVQLNPTGLLTGLPVNVLTGGFLVRGIVSRIQSAQSDCKSTFERLQQRSSAQSSDTHGRRAAAPKSIPGVQ